MITYMKGPSDPPYTTSVDLSRIIPGCSHEDWDANREKLLERVAIHLREHHDLDHKRDPIAEALKTTGIMPIRPI